MPLCDAHNHLHDPRFGGRQAELVAAMRDAGINRCVVNGTRPDDWPAVARLADRFPDFVVPAFGLHPWHAGDPPGDWLESLAGWLDRLVPYSHPVIDLLANDPTPKTRLAVVLSAVIAAPLAEEFFFRRVLQGWLERWVPGGGAVPLAAAVFALMHWGQGLAWVPLFVLGLVLGEIVRRTGSLVPAILLHALFNAVSVTLLLSGVVPGPTPAG